MTEQTKIAVFFGGKISQHLVLLKKAAKKLGVRLDLVSYNRVCFDTNELKVKIRNNLASGVEDKVKNEGWLALNDYDVLFFRTTGKHWEEVDLIMREVNKIKGKKPVVVDPIIQYGKPSMACKAYQMLALKEAGIDVPKTVYGSLWYLYELMKNSEEKGGDIHNEKELLQPSSSFRSNVVAHVEFHSEEVASTSFSFPIILKGSGGDRGTRVYKADNIEELEKLVRELRKSETEEGKRYMLQEYIPNDGDYRVIVLGKKVLGVMKRSAGEGEFKNNYSAGGLVTVADLPQEIKDLAVKAADVCGLWVAGVDVAFRDFDMKKPVIWEVNKGPQFKGFMAATGIDVPREMVKFLAGLKKKV